MKFDPQQIVLDDIADTSSTRDDISQTYALALRHAHVVDWSKVNAAVIERWSESALEYIKRKAWKRNQLMRDGA